MTDKLIILAGGISSRMKNSRNMINEKIDHSILKDAEDKHKSMIRVGESNRPFLDYLLINAFRAGIRQVVLLIGEKDDSIKRYYENLAEDQITNMKISYAVQPIPPGRSKPAGTSDGLMHALDSMPAWKHDSFIVCNGDNLYSSESMNILMNSPYPNALIDYDREGLEFDDYRISRFGLTVKDEDGFLTDIIEKPSQELLEQVMKKQGYAGVSMNIYKLSYDMIYQCLAETPFHSERNEKELPVSVKILITKNPGSVYCYRLKEHVPDLTSLQDITYMREYLKKNNVNFN